MNDTAYNKPLPRIDALSAPYWEGTRNGELRLQRCTACGTFRFPASPWCAHCRTNVFEWVPTSGKGEVWSWCVFHKAYFEGFANEMPYAVALVKLDEGPRVYSNLVGIALPGIYIGLRVRAVFERATDAVTLVKFAMDESAANSAPGAAS